MYTLLTGATGLLGRYVMRDLLLRGGNLAVLVRPNRRASAIERVDATLNYWERAWGRTLPRPVVLAGDIAESGLGLSAADRRWLAGHCQTMIHSAASLTFYEEDDEPWKSNVQGVQHVLDVCESLDILKLYHVSTAYTCGQRTDTIYENELDVGQEYGNDYERSKVQGEQLIRQATWLDVAAFFRPSIIVGDSLTGFSSTFHGFYTPLRLICALLTQLSHEQVFAADYMALMGLTGHEGKNFVQVDWVSQAMVSILERQPEASETYSLTSPSPVSSTRVLDVIREVTGRHSSDVVAPNLAGASLSLDGPLDPIQAAYLEQLRTYRSYWRDDPVFDSSNTEAALPDLPCPTLSDEMLFRMADWAIRSKFAETMPTERQPSCEGRVRVERQRTQSNVLSDEARVLTITGPGGGSWTFVRAEDSFQVSEGRVEGAPELCTSDLVLHRLMTNETTLSEALCAGDLVTVGCTRDLSSWQELFAVMRDDSIVGSEA